MNKCCPPKCILKKPLSLSTTIINAQPVVGPTGPTGPRGERGEAGQSVAIRSTSMVDSSMDANVVASYEDEAIFLDFFIPRGPEGERGPRGEKGDKGDVGPKGVQGNIGPKGDKGDPGPQGPKGERGDKGEKGDKGDQGERGFPGEIGISEVITIDGTETIEPGEMASVVDDKERTVHHLTFYIPKGEKGDRGEVGATGPQGGAGPQGAQGEVGPKGDRGSQGPQGAQGNPGLTPDINATIYNPAMQTITNEGTFLLDEIEITNGFTVRENKGLVSPTTGTFLVAYSVNAAPTAQEGDYVAVAVNNVIIPASKRPLATICSSSAVVATLINENDVVTLTATVAGDRQISATGGPSAMLTVMMISY